MVSCHNESNCNKTSLWTTRNLDSVRSLPHAELIAVRSINSTPWLRGLLMAVLTG
jgi:hypothetical protein